MNYTESLAYLDSLGKFVLNEVWSALKVFCASWAILKNQNRTCYGCAWSVGVSCCLVGNFPACRL